MFIKLHYPNLIITNTSYGLLAKRIEDVCKMPHICLVSRLTGRRIYTSNHSRVGQTTHSRDASFPEILGNTMYYTIYHSMLPDTDSLSILKGINIC